MRFSYPDLRSRPWLLVSAAWLGPAVLAAFQAYLQARLANRPIDGRTLLWEGGDWLIYAALTPLVFQLAARYPLRRGRLWSRLPLHLLASMALCFAWALTGAFFRSLLIPRTAEDWFPSPLSWFLTSLPFGFAVYFAVLATEHAFRFWVESRQRETQAALLAAQLAEARLTALRMQLNPHFLFNSLNTLLVLVRDGDDASAAAAIERLASVLRRLLKVDRAHETPLGDELSFLDQYLAIEEARFSDRLRPVFDVPAELRAAAVPELILQPLVENALRHGIGQRTDSGMLRIAARREGDDLVLTVEDDGAGLPASGFTAGLAEGVGLANTRQRLATLYGARARLDLTPGIKGGAVATLRLPYHELPYRTGAPP